MKGSKKRRGYVAMGSAVEGAVVVVEVGAVEVAAGAAAAAVGVSAALFLAGVAST